MISFKLQKKIDLVMRILLVLIICVIVLFPLYWMFVTSISFEKDTFTANPKVIPQHIDLKGFRDLLKIGMVPKWLLNTLIVSISTAVLAVTMSILAGFSLSRFKFRGSGVFGLLLLLTQMLPEALIIVPVYTIFNSLGLLNTLFPLVLMSTAFNVPIGTWILKNYFDTIPRDLDDAAKVDGCNSVQSLFLVIVPSAIPSIIAVSVIVFFEAWNEYLFSSTLVTKQSAWVASVGLASFIGQYAVPVTQIMAGAIIFCFPALVFYLIFQRYIISGMTSGAVKG